MGVNYLRAALPSAIQEEVITSILTLFPPVTPELVVAVQRMASQFHGQEYSQFTVLAIQMVGGMILVCMPRKISPPLRYF